MKKYITANLRISYMIISAAIIIAAAFWSVQYGSDPTLETQTDLNNNAESQPAYPQETSGSLEDQPDHFTNVLLLGLDKNNISDLILIASYNRKANQAYLISVPRHVYVEEQTWTEKEMGYSHICYASYFGKGPDQDYHQGADVMKSWISYLLEIPIHDYAAVNYEGFIKLIDLFGGVEIYVDPAFKGIEPRFKGEFHDPLPTGLQRLDGKQAYLYASYRGGSHNPRIPEPGSQSEDGDRIRRNQQLLVAIVEQAREVELKQIVPIIRQLPESFYTSISASDMVRMAPNLYQVKLEDLETVVLPGEYTRDVYIEETDRYVHYYYLDFGQVDQKLREIGLK